ncbi:hypothetical protein G4B88_031307, partial [Cannabis sativa]
MKAPNVCNFDPDHHHLRRTTLEPQYRELLLLASSSLKIVRPPCLWHVFWVDERGVPRDDE